MIGKRIGGFTKGKGREDKKCNDLTIVRNRPVSHVASLFLLPPGESPQVSDFIVSEEEKDKSEKAAMKIVMEREKTRGWESEDVSKLKSGFDIRSLSPVDSKTGYREVRRIEVKVEERDRMFGLL